MLWPRGFFLMSFKGRGRNVSTDALTRIEQRLIVSRRKTIGSVDMNGSVLRVAIGAVNRGSATKARAARIVQTNDARLNAL